MAQDTKQTGGRKKAPALALIGAGRMGGAMMRGWLGSGLVRPTKAHIFEPTPQDDLTALGADYNLKLNPTLDKVAKKGVDIAVLAVKPQVMAQVLPTYQPLWDDEDNLPLTISIAAGVSLKTLGALLPEGTPIIRAMPNTPAAIGQGVTALIGNDHVGEAAYELAEALLEAVGSVVRLDSESQMDAVTAVSGSGPAYLFHMAECLTAAGVRAGLPEQMAAQLASGTIVGAANLLDQSDDDPAALRQMVTSPNGTTAAALDVLMGEKGLRDLMSRAVAAAAERSKELDQKG